jgi:sugar/nucleoside kinase (ribokinase family)
MVVVGGGMRVDYLITHEGKAHSGLIGGNAVYAAVGAALWHDDIALWGRVGQNYPHAWLTNLAQFGIQLDGIKEIHGEHDHRTFYAYTPEGVRDDTQPQMHFDRIDRPLPPELLGYVHSTPGQDDPDLYEPLALRPGDWPERYGEAAGVHLGPLSLRTHTLLPPFLRQRGIKYVTVDPGERYMIPELLPYVQQVLSQVDVFLPSDMEVRSLFGDDVGIEIAARQLAQWGPEIVIVKCGAEGIVIHEKTANKSTQIRPWHDSGDERVVDVTGAGDSFCGGFLVGLANSGDYIFAARQGIVSSSLVIEGYGATYALTRPREVVLERFNQISVD